MQNANGNSTRWAFKVGGDASVSDESLFFAEIRVVVAEGVRWDPNYTLETEPAERLVAKCPCTRQMNSPPHTRGVTTKRLLYF